MRKIFTLFVAAMAAVNMFAAWSGSGQGVLVDGQWYALYDASEKNFSTISSKEYTLQAPAAALTYEAKCVAILGFYGGDLKVGQFINGTWSNALFSQQPPKNTYASYGPVELSYDATKVRLYTEVGATGYKYMKNVFATMATYLEAPVTSLSFGEKVFAAGLKDTLTLPVAWCNTTFSAEVSGEGSDLLTISLDEEGQAGHFATSNYTVVYDRSTINTLDAVLTLTGANGATYTIALTGTTVPPTTYAEYNVAFCEGDSIEYAGVWYKEAFVHVDTLVNVFGGDSIVTLTVTVNPTYSFQDEAIQMYVGAEGTWHERDLSTYTVGVYTLYDSLQTEAGCDSIYSVVLTVEAIPATYGEYSAAFCEGDSIEYNGVWYKEEFVGNDTLVAANHLGGDSIVTLTVSVNPTYFFVDAQITIEEGTDSLWHEISLAELAVGEHVLYDSLKVAETGCDSVWSVAVTVVAKEPVGPTTAIDDTMVAPAATKFFRNGCLYIRRGEALYDMSGRKVK